MSSANGPNAAADARTGSRPAGTASFRRQRRAARGAGALHRDRRAVRRPRNAPRSAIPSCASTGSRPAPMPFTWRAWAKFQSPGRYSTTVTQPAFFRHYLLEQLRPLVDEFGAAIEVGAERAGDPLSLRHRRGRRVRASAISRSPSWRAIFPTPMLANVGDEIADGTWQPRRGRAAAARPVRRPADRLLAAPARPLHRHRLAARSSRGSCSPTTSATSTSSSHWALAELRKPDGAYDAARAAGRHDRAARRRPADGRRRGRGRAVAPLPDAGLPPDARRRQGRHHHRQHRRRPLQRQDHRPTTSRCCARIAG